MCGIVGFVDLSDNSTKQIIEDMTASLKHRGPDAQNAMFLQNNDYTIGLGHARLSIIDLSNKASQPMQFQNLIITYNGEVYNYNEIKEELKNLGHTFSTSSDTEVILHAYKEWGKLAVHRFIGMFAFAIYDTIDNTLTFYRDRAGVKPLYIYKSNDLLMFSSELKAFHRHPAFDKIIDIDAIVAYFDIGFVPSPYCIYKNAYKVEAGECISYDLSNLDCYKEKYWSIDLSYNETKLDISYQEAKTEVKKLLESSYAYRLVADVPCGVFLSGGYDSTSVTSILQDISPKPIKTFTIGFHEGNNEAPYAKDIARYLGTDHYEYYCTAKEAQEVIPDLSYYYDEPFADSSAIPTTLVSKFAKEIVTVALSADGGDEIFAGYNQYQLFPKRLSKINKFNVLNNSILKNALSQLSSSLPLTLEREKHVIESIVKTFNTKNHKIIKLYESVRYIPDFHKQRLFNNYNNNGIGFELPKFPLSPEEQLMYIDYKSYLQNDILTKIDRATMSHSLEGREPMLDHRLVEFVSRLPLEYKLYNGNSKRLLKDIVYDYVPKDMMERPKSGFSVPVLTWLTEELSFYLDEYISRKKLDEIEFINTEYALELVEKFKANKLYYKEIIWKLLMFMMWWDRWK